MTKPFIVDLPYPSVDIIAPDRAAAGIIAPSYASPNSEFGAVSQYIYHHFNFYKLGLKRFQKY